MADSLLYEFSNMTDSQAEPFVKKEVVYVTDQNNGAYNGQILLETSSLTNSGKWASYSESYIIAPLVLGLKSDTDITGYAGPNGFMVGLKNGYHQIIDYIQVEYNNTNVVQQTPFTNFYVSYKLMTSFSQDDLAKYGSALNFFPDTATSFQYNTGASVYGNGIANNVVYPLTGVNYATAGFKGQTWNDGLLKRLQNNGYDPSAGFGGAFALYTTPATTGKSYFTNNGGAGAARVYYLNILAKIRLKDVCDFFEKIPLVRGAYVKLSIGTNLSTQTITNAFAAKTMLINAATDLTITSGKTNPILISSSAANNPMEVVCGTANKTFTVGVGIGSLTLSGSTATHNILTSCRIYVPLYTMNPTFEIQYLKLNPTKTIVYRDIMNYNILSVAAGASLTTTLSNGITGAKSIIVIPILSGTAGNNATIALSPHQSPFTTEPATTSPLLAIQNFNVQVAGLNLFPNNQAYDFNSFLDELKSINGINGGITTGLTSGLIGELEFSSAYRYYVADLSRGLPQDDTFAKSIQVIGNNASTKIVDYYCFIEYQKTATIDMKTGQLLETTP